MKDIIPEHSIIIGALGSLDRKVKDGELSILEGLEALSDIETDLKSISEDMIDGWSEMASNDPNYNHRDFLKAAFNRIADMIADIADDDTDSEEPEPTDFSS